MTSVDRFAFILNTLPTPDFVTSGHWQLPMRLSNDPEAFGLLKVFDASARFHG
jgi:hypothetical protein